MNFTKQERDFLEKLIGEKVVIAQKGYETAIHESKNKENNAHESWVNQIPILTEKLNFLMNLQEKIKHQWFSPIDVKPNDGDEVEFIVRGRNFLGRFIESENMFFIGNEDLGDFAFSFEVSNWRLINSSELIINN